MLVASLKDFRGGWFLGNFVPTMERSPHVEVCVKRYKTGDVEATHFQRVCIEYTVVISGRVRMGDIHLGPDEIVKISPGEACDFEALEDSVVVAVKTPSLPDDKVIGVPE